MAAYFQLTRVGSRKPSTFGSIDAAICQNLELPFDEDKYVNGWYDSIGFRLALGHSFARITEDLHWRHEQSHIEFKDERGDQWFEYYILSLRIVHFLNENYTTDSWRGH